LGGNKKKLETRKESFFDSRGNYNANSGEKEYLEAAAGPNDQPKIQKTNS